MVQLEHAINNVVAVQPNKRTFFPEKEKSSQIHSAPYNVSFEIVTEPKSFRLLRNDWNMLTRWRKYPYLQFEWFASCAEAIPSHAQLHTIILKQGNEISAIAPLVLTATKFGKKLEMLGSSLLFEPTGYIYKDEKSLKLLLDYIVAQRLPLHTGRLHKESPESRHFKNEKRLFRCMQIHKSIPTPWLPIQSSWKEYERHISSSRRSAMRRARKKADEYGKVTFEVISPTQQQVQLCLREIFNVEDAGWKRRTQTSIQSNPYLRKFFISYTQTMAIEGKLRLCFMRINGKAVAGQIAIEYADCFWVCKVGYDEQYYHCSPGILLMHYVIQHAFERKLTAFEFMGGDEEWIQMWTKTKHNHLFYWLYPITINGMLWFVRDSCTIIFKKIYHQFSSTRRRKDERD